ncbi:MAG: TIGR04255 family protein [Thermodesulfobacteriota bacterium]
MTIRNGVTINIAEEFEQFPKAPIVEAVIDIRARATNVFEEDPVRTHLESVLPGYAFLDSLHAFQHEVRLEGGRACEPRLQDLGWSGLRFRSADEKHIATFGRDGVAASRLPPYGDWRQFCSEGRHLWEVFQQLAQPAQIHRVGLRFINRIPLPVADAQLAEYIEPAPAPPGSFDLPLAGFMHHDTLVVPGHPYAINVILTIQQEPATALILDIDVFTVQELDVEQANLAHRLEEMRWLKNKVFFGSITAKAKEMFRC